MNEIELKRIIEHKYGNIRAFAVENDIPYTTMRSILERGMLNAKAETIFKICRILNIRPESIEGVDLYNNSNNQVKVIPSTLQKIAATSSELEHKRQLVVLDTAEKQLEEQKQEALQNTVGNSKNTVNEPQTIYFTYNYYDQPASAGTGQYLNDVRVEQVELPIEVNADFVVPIYGDSMEPEYHSGDYVFVKLSVDLSDGDIGVFAYNGEAYIKQLRITDQGAYLHSLNPEYKDIPITADTDFRTIGEVVEVYREK